MPATATVTLPVVQLAAGGAPIAASITAIVLAAITVLTVVGRAGDATATPHGGGGVPLLHDPVTGLAGRTLFCEHLGAARRRALRNGGRFGVLLLDIDAFRDVTSTYGHSHGDAVLTVFGSRLAATLRDTDTIARLGGDEFAVVIEDVDDEEAVETAARRLLTAIEATFRVCGDDVHLRASIGAVLDDGGRSVDDLLRDAEVAMYAAKQAGGHRWSLHRTGMTDDAQFRHWLAAELATAVTERRIDVAFQPVLDLAEGRVVGLEALARWRHPVHGEIPPDRFIPIAESHGLIHDLGEHVLDRALAAVARLRDEDPDLVLRVGVNISAQQLLDPDIVSRVDRVLRRHDVGAQWLILELTESVMLADTEEAISAMRALRSHGVRFAIDDFGTGYSSLSYLRRLPVDIVKIDREFVQAMTSSTAEHDLVAAIVRLGEALHLDVVAEGIEDRAHHRALTRLDCRFGQGFLFSRPLAYDDLAAYLHAPTTIVVHTVDH